MTLPRSAADVLGRHVVFELECIDRVYCNLYVPKLQRDLGVVGFIREHLGKPVASTAVLAERTGAFYSEVRAFATGNGIPVVDFRPGQRKDDVMRERLAQFLAEGRTEGVVFIGRAQEKVSVFATTRRRDAEGKSFRGSSGRAGWSRSGISTVTTPARGRSSSSTAATSPITRSCAATATSTPRPWRPGPDRVHALDNGFAAVDDAAAVQAICDSFDEKVIWDLAARWTGLLPCPYTAEDTRGRLPVEVSVLQAEFSLTQVLDRPMTGRIFFEKVIRDNLESAARTRQTHLRPSRHPRARPPRGGSAPGCSPTG